jgi:hypothetical protein
MTDNEKDWFKLYAGLAMLGLLIRTKGNIFPDELGLDSVTLAKGVLTSVNETIEKDLSGGDH